MTVLVGFAPGKADVAPIGLAANLARQREQPLRVVSVIPAAWPTPLSGGADKEYAAWVQEHGQQAVQRAQLALAELCPDLSAEAVAVPARSVPDALVRQAAEVSATMIVIGSGSGGSWGRVTVNSIADRLLHSSPIPVALALRGYRNGATSPVSRVTCALRGDEESRALIDQAAVLSTLMRVPLRMVTFGVRGRTMYPPEVLGEDLVLEEFMARAGKAQEAAVAALRESGVPVTEAKVVAGRDWAEALDRATWSQGDLLMVGSSPAGLMSRVFLGSSAARIVRHSPVSVVVVP